MNAAAYADRSRAAQHRPLQPRNLRAADTAREHGVPLVVSFIGDTEWSNPTVYCDSGKRYDWSFLEGPHTPWGSFAGLHTVIVVKPGVETLDALPQILARMAGIDYPVLVDVEHQKVACVIEGPPVQLWQVRRGSVLWQQYFSPAP